MFLGMSQADADVYDDWRGTDEGGKLKEAGTIHWHSPNTGATNESGFTALPGGYRSNDSSFGNLGGYAHFWTATKHSNSWARRRMLISNLASVKWSQHYRNTGFSVRCVKNP